MLLLLACADDPDGKSTDPTATETVPWSADGTPPVWDTAVQSHGPQVAFMLPLDGALYDVDDNIRVEILAGDVDASNLAALTLDWGELADGRADTPRNPGSDGTIDWTLEAQPLGDYAISVQVTDTDGLSALATTRFSVVARDADEDGYDNDALGGDDCDDSRVDVSPVAEEVCDGVDNDCDGDVDEDVTVRVYTDADGDGFGDASLPADVCSPAADQVSDASDCDDGRADVFPDGPESCDGADNDCDGEVDEGVLITFWLDADGDGWGDAASTAEACTVPAGYVDNDADCLDSDAAVSPDAEEICLDGLDNDCDGSSNSCGIGGTLDLGAADAQLRGASTYDYAGWAVAPAGDVDGDGLADVLVGAFGAETGGAAYVEFGALSGVGELGAGLVLAGESSGDGAGYAVAGGFDADGDGRGDVLVGAYGSDRGASDGGAAYLVLGGRSGELGLASAELILAGVAASDQAGLAVAGTDDLDGDGLDDLVVGAWGNDDGGDFAGAAYVVSGAWRGSLSLDAAVVLVGENPGDFCGYAVASAGDSDGDGVGDLLVGGYGASAAAGKAWLVLGPVSGTVDLGAADATYIGETAADNAGFAVAGDGDVDGDGLDDAVVGAYGHDYGASGSGAAYVMLGGAHSGASSLTSPDAKVVGENSGDGAGYAVAIAPDMDGDGSDDLLVGAEFNDAGGTDAGAAYLLYGPITTTYDLGTADAKLVGEAGSDYAGASVAGVGDTDGDGKGDILVGAPYEDYGGWSYGGSAYLVRGTGL